MSIALIYDLNKELKRLAIAGSDLSIGDSSLKKLLPSFKKLGESAPVFSKMSAGVEKLINSDNGKSSENLLELTTLVNAVLFTQGSTDLTGEFEEIECTPAGSIEEITYRRLKPVIEALTSKGSGRLEVIRSAYEAGVFKDMRLILPSIAALDDAYSEINDLIMYKVLKGYGKEIVPIIAKNMNINGNKGDARRLEVIDSLAAEENKDLFLKVLEGTSLEMKIAAIKALKNDKDSEEILMEYSNDKKKELRQAAYEALAERNSDSATRRLYDGFCGKDFGLVLQPIKGGASEKIAELLVEEGYRILSGIKDMDSSNKSLIILAGIIRCIKNKRSKTVFEFLKYCLTEKDELYIIKGEEAIRKTREFIPMPYVDSIAKLTAFSLLGFNTSEASELLESLKDKNENHLIKYSFESALRTKSPEYIFDNYSGFVGSKSNKYASSEIIEYFHSIMYFDENLGEYYASAKNNLQYAPNREEIFIAGREKIKGHNGWLHIFMEIGDNALVVCFTEKEDKKVVDYILDILKGYTEFTNENINFLFVGLLRAQYEKAPEMIIQYLDSTNFQGKGWAFMDSVVRVLRFLPVEYADAIEEIALRKSAYPYVMNRVHDAAQYIRYKNKNYEL